MEVGNKIREVRKRLRIPMKELAKKVGISYLTMHRIETGKVSPSVALLSEIAYQLDQPISSLLDSERTPVVHIKASERPVIRSAKLALKLLAPRGMLNRDVSISFGKADPGQYVARHKNEGFELAYIIKGKCIFRHGSKKYELNEGDLVYFDGGYPHSVVALEPLEFLSLQFFERHI